LKNKKIIRYEKNDVNKGWSNLSSRNSYCAWKTGLNEVWD